MPHHRRSLLYAIALGPLLLMGRETLLGAEPQEQENAPALPPGGTSLLPPDPFTALQVNDRPELVRFERVPVTGMPFRTALQITTLQRPPTPYDIQLSGHPTAATRQGDVMLLSFYVRTVTGQKETGEAQSEVVFERASAPNTKAVTYGISIPAKGWKRIDLPFTAQEDLTADDSQLGFRLGYDPQSFEIGGISLLNYGQGYNRDRLPRTKATYDGIEPNAAWRKSAQERIEKHRKGDLTIRVVDAQGKPVRGASVSANLTRHAFSFGSAVAAERLLADTPDARRYQETVVRLFNRVVMENDLKWGPYEENPERARRGVEWLRERNIEVRGHNLVWPSFRNLPGDIQGLAGDKTALTKRLDTHIETEVRAFKGQLVEWDVVNEPFDNHDLMDVLGRDVLLHWYNLARENDPTPRLFLNDYPPLDGGDPKNAHLQSFYDNLTYLQKNHAPLGGIGFQCHFGGNVVPPTRLLSGLDRFSTFGLPIAATEFDIDSTDSDLQTAYTRDFMTALFSHPTVDSIIMWGFWEGQHWKPEAALYRRDWSLRPHGQVWLDLTQREWHTSANGITGKDGTVKLRGFLGDYTVAVAGKNQQKKQTIRLEPSGTVGVVTLE